MKVQSIGLDFSSPPPNAWMSIAAMVGLGILCFLTFSISAPQAATRKGQLRDKKEGK